MEHVWMNLIDSLRELIVLTIAGIIVYKLDHREFSQWMLRMVSDEKTDKKEIKKLNKELEEIKKDG